MTPSAPFMTGTSCLTASRETHPPIIIGLYGCCRPLRSGLLPTSRKSARRHNRRAAIRIARAGYRRSKAQAGIVCRGSARLFSGPGFSAAREGECEYVDDGSQYSGKTSRPVFADRRFCLPSPALRHHKSTSFLKPDSLIGKYISDSCKKIPLPFGRGIVSAAEGIVPEVSPRCRPRLLLHALPRCERGAPSKRGTYIHEYGSLKYAAIPRDLFCISSVRRKTEPLLSGYSGLISVCQTSPI